MVTILHVGDGPQHLADIRAAVGSLSELDSHLEVEVFAVEPRLEDVVRVPAE
ncbi:MAG: hypothetical protein ABGX78_12310 [Microbacterium sp.]|uniref:hypothetical protein n=1 Tax=Microbacterium sp. TaxID=51671 RepID=UPI0032421384